VICDDGFAPRLETIYTCNGNCDWVGLDFCDCDECHDAPPDPSCSSEGQHDLQDECDSPCNDNEILEGDSFVCDSESNPGGLIGTGDDCRWGGEQCCACDTCVEPPVNSTCVMNAEIGDRCNITCAPRHIPSEEYVCGKTGSCMGGDDVCEWNEVECVPVACRFFLLCFVMHLENVHSTHSNAHTHSRCALFHTLQFARCMLAVCVLCSFEVCAVCLNPI